MTKYIIFFFIIIASLIACDTATTTKMKETTITDRTMVTLPPVTTEKKSTITYPITRRDETVSDNYHGTTIADPYRWLEDDHSAETADWVNRQNAVTFDYLSKIPYRDAIKKRLSAVYNYERFSKKIMFISSTKMMDCKTKVCCIAKTHLQMFPNW
jgi:hypothetical protein